MYLFTIKEPYKTNSNEDNIKYAKMCSKGEFGLDWETFLYCGIKKNIFMESWWEQEEQV